MTKQLIKRSNLKQLFKKAISIATAVSALAAASVTSVSAQNIIDAGANNIIFNDFSSTSSAWTLTQTEPWSNLQYTVDEDTAHGSTFEIFSKLTWATGGNALYSFSSPVSNRVLKISYDIKSSAGINSRIDLVDASDSEVYLFQLSQSEAYFSGNWQSGKFDPLLQEGWNHVDVIINQKTGALKCYINGALRREETTDNEKVLNIKSIKLGQYAQASDGTTGQWTRLDNLMISTDEDSRAFGAINYVQDKENNAVYAQLSSSIPSDQNLPTATVKKVGSGDAVTAAVTKYASDTIKIDYSGTALESGAEYMVEFNAPITDISGKTLEPIIFNAPQKTVTKQILSTGIDESEWRLAGENEYGLPENWSGHNGGDGGEGSGWFVGKKAESETNPNNVLNFTIGSWGSNSTVKYNLPSLPDNCELKVSYRTKMHGFTGDESSKNTQFNFYSTVQDSTTTGSSIMVAQNFYNAGDNHNGGLTIATTGSPWWCSGGETLLDADSYQFDKWYTVEVTYHIDGVNRVKADYAIKDETGVVAQANDKNTSLNNGNAIVKPTSMAFAFNNSSKTSGCYNFIDDINISYSYKEAAQPTIRLIGADNSNIVPTSPLKNNFKAFSVLFAGEQQEDTVSATLTEGGNSVALTKEKVGAGLKYNFNLTEFLKPSTTYTFTLNYGGEKTYTYNFTTESSDKINFSDFGFYKADGTKINSVSELNDGDVITVKTRAYNATGDSTKKACISAAAYGDDFLKDVMVDEKTITGSVDGVELSASVTYHTGMNKVLGFLWDGLRTLRPYADSISL